MPVYTEPSGPLDANSHLYYNDKDAIIIDPAVELEEVIEFLDKNSLKLQAILLTHMHFDHAYGCAKMQEYFKLPVYAGKEDIEASEQLLKSASRFGLPKVSDFDVQAIEPGTHQFGSINCQIFFCPGHSPGSLVYYIPEEKVVFTGDVLFYRSIGRTDLYAGDFKTLEKSIKENIYTLPAETTVYCGHGLETTVQEEIKYNSFVRI